MRSAGSQSKRISAAPATHCTEAKPPRGRVSNDALLANLKAIHTQTKGEYGWPRMWKELLTQGVRVGKELVRKLTAQHGIRARHKRK
ncbi:helix-turn-helix protein [Paraburkholderia sp. BL18I3N2]|nr:helix-turn-helix protein [Paraburkholderia sp. BL18I3N2]PRX92643.1 helix-turn-helix protein [Paraburkholderia sp. BL25I1N1]